MVLASRPHLRVMVQTGMLLTCQKLFPFSPSNRPPVGLSFGPALESCELAFNFGAASLSFQQRAKEKRITSPVLAEPEDLALVSFVWDKKSENLQLWVNGSRPIE